MLGTLRVIVVESAIGNPKSNPERRREVGCLNIHGAHVTAINSIKNYVFFLFGFIFENSMLQELLIFNHNALDKTGKIFYATTYLETKSFKTVQK